MNNKAENSSKKSYLFRLITRAILYGFVISVSAVGLAMILWKDQIPPLRLLRDGIGFMVSLAFATAIVAAILLIIHGLCSHFRWLFRRQMIRFYIFGTVCLATLISLFYAVENFRGKRAWQICKAELQAKGQTMDWASLIPPSVPDEQNIFKAPHITEWFVKPSDPSSPLTNQISVIALPPPTEIATVIVVASQTPLTADEVELFLTNTTPNTPFSQTPIGQVERLLRPPAKSLAEEKEPKLDAPQGMFTLYQQELDEPLRIVIRSEQIPADNEIIALFSRKIEIPKESPDSKSEIFFSCQKSGSNSFRIFPERRSHIAAKDYLAFTDKYQTEFSLIRRALQRPYARMDGDYQKPFATPIPNYIAIRGLAQTLAARAQSYLLLGKPEKALDELRFIIEMNRLLQGAPQFLVSSMIQVAITGIYEGVVADGLRLGVWQEPQLIALQQQFAQIDLCGIVEKSFREEPIATCHTLEHTTSKELTATINPRKRNASLLERLKDPSSAFFILAPRGWVYQNMVTGASLQPKIFEGFDSPGRTIKPAVFKESAEAVKNVIEHSFSPYTWFIRIAIPNFTKAVQVTSYNQAQAAQGLIACALERYRLAHGQYPETLHALAPTFVKGLPHDIVGGKPLKYRRTNADEFVLYSIGWNEIDDGGVRGKTHEEGDWVWPLVKN